VRLEKFQKNAIFREIVEGGLDPIECELAEDAEEVRIRHLPSGSFFILGGDARRYAGRYVVGDSALSRPYEASWAMVPKEILRWAREVKQDVDTPDLWAELQRERQILTGARYQAVENTPFTADEQAEIAEQLRDIKEYLKKTYSLSSEQMSRVEARLDEAEAATRRMGRKDWLLLFCGVMFTVIVTDLLPPEAVQHILAMALHGLDHLLRGGGRPPQLPPIT
jgi:hypothetical protein